MFKGTMWVSGPSLTPGLSLKLTWWVNSMMTLPLTGCSLHLEHTDFGGNSSFAPTKGSLLADKGNRLVPAVHHVTAQKTADALLHGNLQPLHESHPNFVARGSKDSHCNGTMLQIMLCIIFFYKYLKTTYIYI